LREYALELGLPADVRLLSQAEQIIFLRENIFRLPLDYYRPLGDPTSYLSALVTFFSRCRDEDVSPEEYLDFARELEKESLANPQDKALAADAKRHKELAQTYAAYCQLKAEAGCIDFGDQVALPLALFRSKPGVLKLYQERFRYILVDEFQDTNYAQFELLKLLSAGHRNVTVVGDDDQSIYKFRGAAISNILNFMEHYPDATTVVLRENYRSTQQILDCAYRLIRHNDPERLEAKHGVDKRLVAARGDGHHVHHCHFDTLSSESDFVAKKIQEEVDQGRRRYRDFAILVRSNRDAEPFIRSLNVRAIPSRFSGNRGLYGRPEVTLAISFLKAVVDVNDSMSLYNLAQSHLYGFPPLDLSRCVSHANRVNRPLFTVLERLETIPQLEEVSQEARAVAFRLVSDLARYVEMSQKRSAGEILYTFLQESGWLKKLARADSAAAQEELQNLARFFSVIRDAEAVLQDKRAYHFVTYLDMLMEAGDDPATAEPDPEIDAVQVMTVHKAKGLEFPVVFMVSLIDRRFPHDYRSDKIPLPDKLVKDIIPGGNIHLQEERRLFYVGMTRAMDELYLTSAEDYGGVRTRKVSQFVLEALDMARSKVSTTRVGPMETIEQHAPAAEAVHWELEAIPEDEVITISFHQIDDYLTCPLKFKYVNILRVPVLRHHAVVYGKAMHDAVAEYNRRKAAGLPVALERLIEVFQGSWSSEGFLSLDHEERRLEAGKAALARFFEKEQSSPRVPTYVEKDFSFMVGNNRVVGRWDRVDVTPEETVLMDFKSSEAKDKKDADRKASKSLQLAVYAMGYRSAYGKLPDAVELYFLENGIVGRAVKTDEELAKVEEEIKRAAEGIRARRFEATPDYQACRYCAYNEICPYAVSASP
jgi:DNA helicase-2/ATP-dependent DNA helicase PcrA